MHKVIQSWANKLLDTGNRNNLVNFKDRKGSTLEFVFHDPAEIFDSLAHGKSFEFFNPKEWFKSNSSKEEEFPKTLLREEYAETYSVLLGKNDCLAFNQIDADSGKIIKRIMGKLTLSLVSKELSILLLIFVLLSICFSNVNFFKFMNVLCQIVHNNFLIS